MARLSLILVMLLQSALWPILAEQPKTKADKPATCCGETCCCGLPLGSGCPCIPAHERTPGPQTSTQKVDQAQSPARPQLTRRANAIKPTKPGLVSSAARREDPAAHAPKGQHGRSPPIRSMLCVWTV